MATLIKIKTGWQAQVRKGGIKSTKNFPTKSAADITLDLD